MTLELTDLYRTMLRIRLFEQRVSELFRENQIPGFIHLAIGQESVAAGVVGALAPNDFITATHRGHGQMIAKGAEMGPMMAELMARESGYCRGRGGSMHITCIAAGVLGANGILGAGQPIAVGAALSARLRGTEQIAVTFFGEGASAQGAVHEAMNLAACWNLPVLFVAEVNGWAELTPTSVHVAGGSISSRAVGYGMVASIVDGQEVKNVYDAACAAVETVRSRQQPAVLEITTNRQRGHFEGDPQKYREDEDRKFGMSLDPVRHAEQILSSMGLTGVIDETRIEVEEEVEKAVAFALSSPWPEPDDVLKYVYADTR